MAARNLYLFAVLSACTPIADAGDGPDRDADGFSTAEGDCDDMKPSINPASTDIVGDAIDQNCEGVDGTDADQDGFASLGSGGLDCDDAMASVNPVSTDIVGDATDQNCDGVDGTDVDGDGFASVESGGSDCSDLDDGIHPGAEDLPDNGVDEDCSGEDEIEQADETDEVDDSDESSGMVPEILRVSGSFGWDPETESVTSYTAVNGDVQNPVVILELTAGADTCFVWLTAIDALAVVTDTWDQTDEFDDEGTCDIVHTGFYLTPDTYTMETDCELSSDWGTVEDLLGEDGWGIGVGNVRSDVDAEWAVAVEEDPQLEATYGSLLGAGIYLGVLEGSDWAPSGYIGVNYGFGYQLDETGAVLLGEDEEPIRLLPADVINENGTLPRGAFSVYGYGNLVFQ